MGRAIGSLCPGDVVLARGLKLRIVGMDGAAFPHTMDFRPNRVNVWVEGGQGHWGARWLTWQGKAAGPTDFIRSREEAILGILQISRMAPCPSP
jgi:hypothetical protein